VVKETNNLLPLKEKERKGGSDKIQIGGDTKGRRETDYRTRLAGTWHQRGTRKGGKNGEKNPALASTGWGSRQKKRQKAREINAKERGKSRVREGEKYQDREETLARKRAYNFREVWPTRVGDSKKNPTGGGEIGQNP